MEHRGSMRSVASTASKRKKSAKAIRYSARALAQFILVATGVFVALALLGLSVQAYRFAKGNSPSIFLKGASKVPANPEAESLSSLAFAATVTAVRLWGKLLLSILIPTTEHSLVYAKEGWGALEPSLRQSVFWFVFETSPMFKLGVFLAVLSSFLAWLLEREIKRRRIVERVSARVKRVTDRINAFTENIKVRYARIRAEIERESRIAAQLLPHILYIMAVAAMMLAVPDMMHQISRGFGAWTVIVGWPVVLSARRMLHYDEIRRARLKRLNPADEALSSSEDADTSSNEDDDRSSSNGGDGVPQQKRKFEAYMESLVQTVRKRLLSDASLTPVQTTYGLSSENIGDFDPITEWLRYWSVLSICLFVEQFPFTGHFLSVVPIWPEIRLAFALWLQLPVTRGCDWAFTALVPLLDKYVKKIPALQLAQNQMTHATVEQRGIIVSILSSLGIVSKKTGKKLLKATEMNGTLLMVSVPFMLSPSFITKIGVLIVGLAFPAHASTTCVLELEHLKKELKKHDGAPLPPAPGAQETEDDHAAHSDAGEQSVFWLEYWVVYVLFSLVHAPLATMFGWWFPLWDQFHLAILLWMQISYFSGARNVFNIAVVVGRVWRRRRRAALRRRSRTSSVPGVQEKIEEIVGSIPLLSPLIIAAAQSAAGGGGSDISAKGDDDEHTDADEEIGTGEEDGSAPLHDEDSVKLKGSEDDAQRRRLSARGLSEATITKELGTEVEGMEAKDQSLEMGTSVDTQLSDVLDDEFIAVERADG